MPANHRSIVVVGTSSGGMDALGRLVAQLPADFPAALFVVQHMSADNTGEVLLQTLVAKGRLKCEQPVHGDKIVPGRLYLARSDHHMMIEKGRILITKGARENRSRPAIDPLFRSAAVAYAGAVIGVVLTGQLDDGTSGMLAIKRCGGVCVVQDPKDAAYPDMPQNVMNYMKVDHCLPLDQMGALLVTLTAGRPGRRVAIPKDILIETNISKRVLSDLKSVGALGARTPFNCPACGGVLWKVFKGPLDRYRCHTGHAFTSNVLLAEQSSKIEETLWVALRMFEERRNLLTTLAPSNSGGGISAAERATDSEIHIARIRKMLMSADKASNDEARKRKG